MVSETKEIVLSTRAYDYNNPESASKGKEIVNPQNSPYIDKTRGGTMTCIPKGVYKCVSNNPNDRSMPNYSINEDLA